MNCSKCGKPLMDDEIDGSTCALCALLEFTGHINFSTPKNYRELKDIEFNQLYFGNFFDQEIKPSQDVENEDDK
jgi:hypothetical protein